MKKIYYPFLTGHSANKEEEMFIRIEPANRKYLLNSLVLNVDDRSEMFPGPPNELKKIRTVEVVKIRGGELITKKNTMTVQASGGICEIQLRRKPGSFHPMSIQAIDVKDAKAGNQYVYHIKQLNSKRQLVGGITVIFQKSNQKR